MQERYGTAVFTLSACSITDGGSVWGRRPRPLSKPAQTPVRTSSNYGSEHGIHHRKRSRCITNTRASTRRPTGRRLSTVPFFSVARCSARPRSSYSRSARRPEGPLFSDRNVARNAPCRVLLGRLVPRKSLGKRDQKKEGTFKDGKV